MEPVSVIQDDDGQATRDLLIGRRIVRAETGEFDVGRYDKATGRLDLDDGTQVYVIPNIGGCTCGAGDYYLDHLATVDNAITDVRVAAETQEGDYEEAKSYRIYVLADAVEINAVQIDGDDGNGYYGTGYELYVVRPEVAA